MSRRHDLGLPFVASAAALVLLLPLGPAQAASPPAGAVAAAGYCTSNSLAANDDESAGPVPLPFPVNFAGTLQNSVYVNNNGNVTFGGPLVQFTPSDLTGPTSLPIIAPFFADVDTRGAGSQVVTYGASPDGKAFCVNWVNVGYFASHADHLNSFQLLLVNRAGLAGGKPGDFDIVFNYDTVTWESGDVSGGSGGIGGTVAQAGYSFGTAAAGTYFQLAGSGVSGSLLDGGPHSLVAGSRNSLSQAGRYVFYLRSGAGLGGDVAGTVRGPGGGPVAEAYVEICPTAEQALDRCATTQTNGSGAYSFVGITVGDYTERVLPPANSDLLPAVVWTKVTAGALQPVDVTLARVGAMPDGTTITHVGMTATGAPILHWQQKLLLTQRGCVNGEASYTITQGGATLASGPMRESPAGLYTAVVPPLYPAHGPARVSISIICPDAPDQSVTFDVYIDPSGVVVDQAGNPVRGATVTLTRSDNPDGPFQAVPDGSAIMSPSNRSNPITTDLSGRFAWDVMPGYYVVTAAVGACAAQTEVMAIPPPRTDLVVTLPCVLTPSAPRAVRATARGTRVTVRWRAPARTMAVVGYTVAASRGDRKHWVTQTTSLRPTARRFTARGKHRTTYYLCVAAISAHGVGTYSRVRKVVVR